jgi:hypothetical protein
VIGVVDVRQKEIYAAEPLVLSLVLLRVKLLLQNLNRILADLIQ